MILEIVDEGVRKAEEAVPMQRCCWWIMSGYY